MRLRLVLATAAAALVATAGVASATSSAAVSSEPPGDCSRLRQGQMACTTTAYTYGTPVAVADTSVVTYAVCVLSEDSTGKVEQITTSQAEQTVTATPVVTHWRYTGRGLFRQYGSVRKLTKAATTTTEAATPIVTGGCTAGRTQSGDAYSTSDAAQTALTALLNPSDDGNDDGDGGGLIVVDPAHHNAWDSQAYVCGNIADAADSFWWTWRACMNASGFDPDEFDFLW